MRNSLSRTPARFATINLCVHVALGCVLLVVLLVLTPRAEVKMKGYGLTLPALTLSLLNISRWIGSYLVLLVVALLPLLGLDYVLLFVPRLGARTRRISTLWGGICLVLLVLALVIAGVALYLPYLKVAETITK